MAESERLEQRRAVKIKKFSTQYRKERGGLKALPFLNIFLNAFYPLILFSMLLLSDHW